MIIKHIPRSGFHITRPASFRSFVSRHGASCENIVVRGGIAEGVVSVFKLQEEVFLVLHLGDIVAGGLLGIMAV